MLLEPKMQVKRVTDITIKMLEENDIKAIILDVDNTLIDLDGNKLEDIENWINMLKENNIKVCIASNSLKKEKIDQISKLLEIEYIYFATKPLKRGLKKAKKMLKVGNSKNIAEVGDQLFTDVLGSNRMKMFSILTEPISSEKHKINNVKRRIEQKILSKRRKN